MAYIGKSMSTNARLAYQKGLFPKSKVTSKMLKDAGFPYSIAFFKWLCKKNYIVAQERHHTSASMQITNFYSISTITFVAQYYDLASLYQIYLKRKTKEEVMQTKHISYVRVAVPAYVVGLKATLPPIPLDCVSVGGKLFWKPDTIIVSGKKVEEWSIRPQNWLNKQTKLILRRAFLFKQMYVKAKL